MVVGGGDTALEQNESPYSGTVGGYKVIIRWAHSQTARNMCNVLAFLAAHYLACCWWRCYTHPHIDRIVIIVCRGFCHFKIIYLRNLFQLNFRTKARLYHPKQTLSGRIVFIIL